MAPIARKCLSMDTNKRVLIVEDDRYLLELLRCIFAMKVMPWSMLPTASCSACASWSAVVGMPWCLI